jgi:hypothetical protein
MLQKARLKLETRNPMEETERDTYRTQTESVEVKRGRCEAAKNEKK